MNYRDDDDEEEIELDAIVGAQCDRGFCRQRGVAFNEDGEFLCEDHFIAWTQQLCMQMHDHQGEDDEADRGDLVAGY